MPQSATLARDDRTGRYKRVELWDRREGALPNPDVEYPELPQAAAFVCTAKSCSSPIRKPDQLLARALRQ